MSKKITVSKAEYRVLAKIAKKDNLSVDEEVEMACLKFFYVWDRNTFEEMKPHVTNPKILEVFYRKYG